ncbi:MBL fold metallo-hydrolase [Marinovum algicola]|uniref:MBL fold metallo-hydrolase n=1 Tax=Marinovum algicola TaxID=42444 RepID=UPI0024BB0959|nr:MBL fold metallo-hydrolase [Marinovum algicola]
MMMFKAKTLPGLLLAGLIGASVAAEEAQGDFVVTLLGTGVPDPRIDRFGGSTLVQAGGLNLVFDAGRGAMQRIDQLNIVPAAIDHIFLTHFHSDHTIGLPDLWLTPWLPPQGRREEPRTITGPVGTRQLTEGLTLAYAEDHRIRIADAGLNPKGVEWDVTEFTEDGPVFEENGVTVTAFANFHGEHLDPSYGYRIDFDGRAVVISGDTKPNENVVEHATGVDLLVHEVAMADPKIAERPPIKVIMGHHTDPTEAAKIFTRTRPKMAAFTHFVFLGQGPGRPDAGDVMAEAKAGYDGPMIDGVDLMQFVIGDTVEVLDPREGN